jgi:hypothetical protein
MVPNYLRIIIGVIHYTLMPYNYIYMRNGIYIYTEMYIYIYTHTVQSKYQKNVGFISPQLCWLRLAANISPFIPMPIVLL